MATFRSNCATCISNFPAIGSAGFLVIASNCVLCGQGNYTRLNDLPSIIGDHYQLECATCKKVYAGCNSLFLAAPTKTVIFDDPTLESKINIKCKTCFTPTSLPESALTQDIITFTCCGATFKHPDAVNKIKKEMREIREKLK